MTEMRIVTAVTCLLWVFTAQAQNCKNPTSAPEVNECAAIEQKRVEGKLNASYARVLRTLEQPDTDTEKRAELKRLLVASQRAWVLFRRADCDALYKRNEAGSARTVILHECLQRHAERRISDLNLFAQ
jgi:uncharacterized protein YecT (DUF1311 family)